MAKKQHIAKEQAAERSESGSASAALDPRLVIIARAIGRLIAREQANATKGRRDP